MALFATSEWSSDDNDNQADEKSWSKECLEEPKVDGKAKKSKKKKKHKEAPPASGVKDDVKSGSAGEENGTSQTDTPRPPGSLLRMGIKFESAEDFEAFKSGKKKNKKNKFKADVEDSEKGESSTPQAKNNKKNKFKADVEDSQNGESSLPQAKKRKFDIDGLKAALSSSPASSNDRTNSTTHNSKEKTKNPAGGGGLVDSAKAKLKASRFRYLNELLYTQEGKESLRMFSQDPDAFQTYHEGYADQVRKWPLNPLDLIIKSLAKRKDKPVVADFGCGEAKLAEALDSKCQTVHSLDLVAVNDRVTVCDFSRTPLASASVDVAVFCLSLMGSNLKEFLHEANRVLKEGATLKIAEVESRFTGDLGLDQFVANVERMGFKLKWKDMKTEYFYLMDFEKVGPSKLKKVKEFSLKPCIYKKR